MATIIPPIKCQGIKTKLVPSIVSASHNQFSGTWIEPFVGSGVVALNVQPPKALLTDSNMHIIGLYNAIQSKAITAAIAREFLEQEGAKLLETSGDYYYVVRSRFNETGSPLDFLFLNRSCFNGVMRFNRKGQFNVPFCRKPNRFSKSYVTKIVNQISSLATVIQNLDWEFRVADFRATLNSEITENDFVYADPPYIGRHVDYFNSWSEADELEFIALTKQLPCKFVVSTWHSNQYRSNAMIDKHWKDKDLYIHQIEHFYHVGSTEDLRNAMMEALISNFRIDIAASHVAYVQQNF